MRIGEIRRENLELVLAELGGPKALADKADWVPNYVSQLRKATKSFGDVAADKIEKAARKPKGWMDERHTQLAQKRAKLTKEGSDEAASPELMLIRLHNAVTSTRLALGAMAAIMAAMRPEEGAAVAALFRSGVDPDYQDLGLGEHFLEALDKAVAASGVRPSSRLRKGG